MRTPIQLAVKATLALLLLSLGARVAEAQIVVVQFKDEKTANRYKKHTVETVDGMVLIGEPVEGGGVTVSEKGIAWRRGGGTGREDTSNAFYKINVDDPSDVPYKFEDGEKKLVRKKAKAIVDGADIAAVSFFSRTEDLYSLSVEYEYRMNRIADLEDERKSHKKGTPEWFEAHRQVTLEYKRLGSWLKEVGFFGAASKYGKTIGKADKAAKGDAIKNRREDAVKSAELVDIPDDLRAVTTGYDAEMEWAAVESTHFRFYWPTYYWSKEAMLDGARFAEEVLDGFRVEFIDNYLAEDFKDQVPSGKQMLEFCFVPQSQYEGMWVDFYKGTWTDERSKGLGGTGMLRRFEPRRVTMIKLWEEEGHGRVDLESTITNRLGKLLASLHFGGGYSGLHQPWIAEGLAYYLSFEYCGRNTWTTIDWSKAEYAKGARKEGEKTAQLGLRLVFNDMALVDGAKFDKLTLMTLAEMTNADLAKSWSVFDWVVKELGEEGQRWLRSACIHSKDKRKFLTDWRADSEALFDVTGQDVFKVVEGRWKEYAEAGQDLSEDARQKKKR